MKLMQETCIVKTAIGTVIGGGLGAFTGLFFSSVSNDPLLDPTKMTTKENLKLSFRQMSKSTISSAKNFAIVGALFTSTECAVEKARGQHDMVNTLAAGCFSGGALAHKAGPKPMAMGCLGFAGFSLAMEKIFEGFDH